MDVKLGLTLRKGLWDLTFTSLLGHCNSPRWWQQDMTCVLSTQCPIWCEVDHIFLNEPYATWCTGLQLLYTAAATWWPAALHDWSVAEATCCTFYLNPGWVFCSDPGQPSQWCNVVTGHLFPGWGHGGKTKKCHSRVAAAVLAPQTMVHSISHFVLWDWFQVALQSSYYYCNFNVLLYFGNKCSRHEPYIHQPSACSLLLSLNRLKCLQKRQQLLVSGRTTEAGSQYILLEWMNEWDGMEYT